MNIITLLKPNLKKIGLSVLLILTFGFIFYILLLPGEGNPAFGFPLPFYFFGGESMTGKNIAPNLILPFLLMDVVIWYIFSCLLLKND